MKKIKCLAALVAAGVMTLQPLCLAGLAATALDLSSKVPTAVAPAAAIIRVGSQSLHVHAGDALTPSELIAVQQILQTGRQQLIIGAYGNAVGGTLNLDNTPGSLSSVNIPSGVTALDNFSSGSLSIAGTLTNSGRLFAFSTSPSIIDASIAAATIANQRGALISSVLPLGSFGITGANAVLNLDLGAQDLFSNHGSIISSGALNISGSSGIINTGPGSLLKAQNNLNLATNNLVNNGSIISQSGSINIAPLSGQDLKINNAGGTINAVSQDVNINNALYSALSNVVIRGGNFLSNQLNIDSGNGTIDIVAGKITGLLNTQAKSVFVQASTPNLAIGQTEVSGDPTFFNTSGNITINSPLNFAGTGNSLAIVAKGNIVTAINAGLIDTSSAGPAGSITLIAGANFTSTGGTSTTQTSVATGDTTSTLKITGPSTTGGKIDLTGAGLAPISSLTAASSGQNGGNITLVAYAGSASGSGTIALPSTVTINTAGTLGSNGNVLMIAGATSGTAIKSGPINADGGAGTSGGNIGIYAAKPVVSGVSITDGVLSGTVSPGAPTGGAVQFVAPTSTPVPVAAGGSFTLSSGGTVDTTKAAITSAGNLSVTSTGSTVTAGALTSTNGTASASAGGSLTVTKPIYALGDITLKTTAKNGDILVDANVVSINGSVTASTNGTGSIEVLNQVIKKVPLTGFNDFPVGASPTPDGAYVFVPDYQNNQIYIISTATNTQVGTVTGVFSNPQGTAMDPAGGILYVTNYAAHTISVVTYSETSGISASVTGTYTMPVNGSGFPISPEAAALSKDGKTLYVYGNVGAGFAAPGTGYLTAFDTTSATAIKTITLGASLKQTGGIAINPQGTLAWVTNSGAKTISVIDLSTTTVKSTIDMSQYGVNNPISLVMNPTGTRIFVSEGNLNRTTNVVTGAVAIIDALPSSKTFNQVIGTVNFAPGAGGVGTFPQGITTNATGTETFTQTTYGFNQLPNTINLYSYSSPQLTIGVPTGTGTDGIGSNTWSTVVHNGSINNLTTFTSDTYNFQSNPQTVSVVQEPTIQGKNINLTAGGFILGSYDALGGTLTANATGKNSQIILSNVGNAPSTIGNSKSTGVFQVGSLQSLMVAGKIASPNVILETTANNGSITIGSGANAVQIGQAGGSVLMSASGTGSIIQGNATSSIVGAHVTFNTASGDIGSLASNIRTTTPDLAVNSGAQAFVSNTGAVTLTNSTANSFDLTNSGNIVLATNGSINAPNIMLATTGSGAITLNADIGLGTIPGDNITLLTGGTGAIQQDAGPFLIKGNNVTLGAGGGTLGTTSAPLRLAANNLTVGPAAASTPASAYLLSTGAVMVLAANAKNTLTLNSQTDITYSAPASAAKTLTIQALGGANIFINAGATTIGSTNSSSTVTFSVANGAITDPGSTPITGNIISLQSSKGDIGTALNPIFISGQNLQSSTPGQSFIVGSNTSAPQGYTLGVKASSAGTSYNLSVAGNISINGAINAPNAFIQTGPSLDGSSNPSGNSQVTIGANVGQPGAGNSVTIWTAGAVGKDDSIIFKSGSILGQSANLMATNSSIGSSSKPINLSVQQLTANALDGSIYISNSAPLNFNNSTAGGTFSATVAGNLNVNQPVLGLTALLTTSNNGSITASSSITGNTVTLTAGGSGGLFTTPAGSVTGINVSLISTSGNIGTSLNPFTAGGGAATGTVTVKTGGNAYLKLAGTTFENLGKSTVGSNALLSVTSTPVTPVIVTGALSAGTIQMNMNGGLETTATLSAKVINITDINGVLQLSSTIGSSTSSVQIAINDTSLLEGGSASSVNGSAISIVTGGGSIGALVPVGVATPALTVSDGGAGIVALTATKAVTISSVSTVGAFSLTGPGSITTAGTMLSNGINLQSGGNISIGSSLNSIGSINLQTTGASSAITMKTGVPALSGTSVTLSAVNGNIGSSGAPILTAVTTLAAATKGQAFLNNTGNVTLAQQFTGSAFNLTNDGALFIAHSLSAKTLNINAIGSSASTVTLNGSVGQTGATVTLSSAGNITQASSLAVTGNTVTIKTQAGDIGLLALPVTVNTPTLKVSALGGNAFLNDTTTGNLNLQSAVSSANYNTYQVTTAGNVTVASRLTGFSTSVIAGGNITVNAGISGQKTTLTAGTNGNGSVSISPSLVVGTGSVGGTQDVITAHGKGTITGTNTSGLISDAIILNTDNGNIGTSKTPLVFITLAVTVNSTKGSAQLLDVGTGVALTFGGTVGGEVNLQTRGSSLAVTTLTVGSGSTTGNNLTITQEGGQNSGTSGINITGNITVDNGSINISQQGSGALSTTGNISATSGNITMVQQGAGALSINGDVTSTGGSIVLQDTNTAAGAINLGTAKPTGITISTLVPAGAPAGVGDITIAIGKIPPPALNPGQAHFPLGVTVNATGGGNAYAGSTPAAFLLIGAPVTLNATGRNIDFNSPNAANFIRLGTNLTVTADPPVPAPIIHFIQIMMPTAAATAPTLMPASETKQSAPTATAQAQQTRQAPSAPSDQPIPLAPIFGFTSTTGPSLPAESYQTTSERFVNSMEHRNNAESHLDDEVIVDSESDSL